MFNYKLELNVDGKWEVLHGWDRPFTDGETLDESLDSGKFTMKNVKRKEMIEPFTRLRITVYKRPKDDTETPLDDLEQLDTIDRLVLSDRVTLKRFQPFPLYDHEVQTIELTKMLEREICDTMTVTNYLGHDYGGGGFSILPFQLTGGVDCEADGFSEKQNYFGPVKLGEVINIRDADNQFNLYYVNIITNVRWDGGTTTVRNPNNEVIFKKEGSVGAPATKFLADIVGTYSVEYDMQIYQEIKGIMDSGETLTTKYTYYFNVFESLPSYTDWTITDVVNRLLTAGTTRRVGVLNELGTDIDKQKYVFDAEQAEKYSKVMSPEFFFTRSTLFEALLNVGGYIHAIPRLVDNDGVLTVRFDELSGNKVYEDDLPSLIYEDCMMNADEYCGALDSPVDNLLNTRDRTQGAVMEPDAHLFKTVRAEEGTVEISADTMIIKTELPIYRIVKLECGFLVEDKLGGDITPYVYEAAEYETLSSHWGSAYPYSKGYALRYAQGDNKITGLNFKLEHETSKGTAFGNYAIYNILNAKGFKPDKYIDIAFRVTYIPIVSARIVEKKALYNERYNNNTLIYNQSGNTVESEFYGTKMKGVLARIGNKVYRRTYRFNKYDKIPQCGQIVDNMYVAAVDKEFELLWIKVTLTLTPNFNKLADYIGVNSNYRMYDISEKQSVDRHINYGETCLISKIPLKCGKPMLNINGILSYKRIFDDTKDSNGNAIPQRTADITSAVLQGGAGRMISNELIECTRIGASVTSMPLGNSLTFITQYKDNYGAEYQSTNEYEDNGKKRVQKLVRYCDALGNMSVLDIKFGVDLWNASYSSQKDGGNANLYPEVPQGDVIYKALASTLGNPFYVSKDSRERLVVVYQIHHQTNDGNIVIGPMLTQRNPLIGGYKGVAGKLYFLPNRISALTDTIDLTDAVQADIDISSRIRVDDKDRIYIGPFKNKSDIYASSWAIVDEATDRLYIGENIEISPNDSTEPLYFNFMDNAALSKMEEDN